MSQTALKRWSLLVAALLVAAFVLPAPGLAATRKPKTSPTPTPDPYDAGHPEMLADDNLRGASCVLIDADTGRVLYDKSATKRRHPASTTKMMTLLLALEYGRLDDTVTVPKESGGMAEDSSVVPVTPGEKINFLDLLYGLVLKSGNDAANAVAIAMDGSIKGFVGRMNQKAEELGLTGTHFTNAHGLEREGHYSTALDLAKLARAGMQNELFREIVGTTSYALPATNKHEKRRIEGPILLMDPESKYYYEGTLGIKTGTFINAGYCFVGAAQRNGVTLISVTLKSTEGGRWTDTRRLMDYGFSQYKEHSLADLYAQSPLSATVADADGDATLALNLGNSGEKVRALPDELQTAMASASAQYTRELVAPIAAGDVLGTYTLSLNGRSYSAELVASRDVAKKVSPLPFLGGTDSGNSQTPAPDPDSEPAAMGGAPTAPGTAPLKALLAVAALAGVLVIFLVVRGNIRRNRRRRQQTQRRLAAQRAARQRTAAQAQPSQRTPPRRAQRPSQPGRTAAR